MENRYDDKTWIADEVEQRRHRDIIGGMWDTLGEQQFNFMVAHGLKPTHKLLDVGCGALRGGVHFVKYLEPGNYFGIDNNRSLLDAGYDIELAGLGLAGRMPRSNLVCSQDFEMPVEHGLFDFMIAQSVFSHMTLNTIRVCLEKLDRNARPGGSFFATYFELPDTLPTYRPHTVEVGGKKTYGARDPYHYRFEDLSFAASRTGWEAHSIGDWKHPRGQYMAHFRKAAS